MSIRAERHTQPEHPGAASDDEMMLAELVSPELGRAVREDDDAVDQMSVRSGMGRGLALTGMLVIFLAAPLADVVSKHYGAPRIALVAVVLVAFLGLFGNLVLTRDSIMVKRPTPYVRLALITAIGLSLPLAAGPVWLVASGIVGACFAAYLPGRQALAGVLCMSVFCGVTALATHVDSGNAIIFTFEPLVIGGFAYASGRRVELIQQLRQTRRELARNAVAAERLRIGRDLHDLLGHSLSVIAVKAELARRMLPVDPERAQREIGEVEAAARRALHEVRDAVTGYRAPSLAVELVSCRRALTAAGVRCFIDTPDSYQLRPEVDALLAWAAREGTTNVVRHGAASRCDVKLTPGSAEVALELTNDGPAAPGTPQPPAEGNGLCGLAERAARLGGTMTAGPRPGGGFTLRVVVPA